MLTYVRNKTKMTCPCGAQSPLLLHAEFDVWQRSETGRAWAATHRPHGRVEAVVRGGKTESLDEALAKKTKIQDEAIAAENDLPEALK